MNIDRMVFRLAGIFVLVSVALALVHSTWWLALTAFVGLNMFQASFTGFCPLAKILGKVFRLPPGSAFSA